MCTDNWYLHSYISLTFQSQCNITFMHSISLWSEVWKCYIYIIIIYIYTIGPRLFESPLSKPSVIRTLLQILKSQKTIWFSAKTSNKWNAYVIFRLHSLVISKYSKYKSILICVMLSATHSIDRLLCTKTLLYIVS